MDIPILNIYYLLSYAWNKLEEADTISVGQIDKNDAQNLFGRVLSNSTSYLIRKGLDRGYIEHREDTRTIRGKINLTPTIKKNLLMDAKVDCSFDELSYNVLHNRILKSTIRALMSTEDVDKTIRDELSLSYRKLEAIEEIELRKNLFRRLQFSRNNFFYDFLMKICELITDNLLIDEEGKENKFRDFLQNEKAMAYLFEDFVGNFYRKHKSDHGFKVRTQKQIDWVGKPLDKTSEDYLPKMQADVILESSDKKIVLDTKYYKETLQENYGKKTIHSENLYQIFSYIKNLEVLGGLNETCEGILLYPTIDESFPGADYEIQGHRVSVRTVNLNQDWRGIHEELIRVIH